MYVDLLTPEDAAKRLHVTTGTLAVWRSTGRYKIPFIKVGSKVMYRAIDLEQFLNDRMRTVA